MPVHGSFEFFRNIDGHIFYFRPIEDIDLEWFLFIPTDNEVVCVAFKNLRLAVWERDYGSFPTSEILYAILLLFQRAIAVHMER